MQGEGKDGFEGQRASTAPPDAERRVLCRDHCRECGRHFSSTSAFDLHRRGSFRKGTRRCVDPTKVRTKSANTSLTAKSEDGFCEIGLAVVQRGVTVWQIQAASEKTWGQ